jgi:hypothetical protein
MLAYLFITTYTTFWAFWTFDWRVMLVSTFLFVIYAYSLSVLYSLFMKFKTLNT